MIVSNSLELQRNTFGPLLIRPLPLLYADGHTPDMNYVDLKLAAGSNEVDVGDALELSATAEDPQNKVSFYVPPFLFFCLFCHSLFPFFFWPK